MYCKKCGHEIKDDDKYCPNCGAPVDDELGQYRVYGQNDNYTPNNYPQQNYNNDTGSAWWGILALFFPLLGLILYILWRRKKPRTAKILLVGTIIGFVLNIALNFILMDMIEIPVEPAPNPGTIPDTPNSGVIF